LESVPQVGAALAEGRIGLPHAVTIGRVAGAGTAAQQDAVRSVSGQQYLLRLAERQDAQTFATSAARWAAAQDPRGLERDHQAQRANRFLHVVDTPRGTLIKGQVDSMAGHRL